MLLCYIENIPVYLTRKNVVNINMRISRDFSVHVSAPYLLRKSKIKEFVHVKKTWIIKSVQKEKNKQDLLNKYKTTDDKAKILYLATPSLNKYQRITGLKAKGLRAKNMSSLWGSYSLKTGYISINTRLLAYDQDIIDYIVLHELLHIKYHNHGAKFKKALTSYMPDWKTRSRKLK